MRPSIDLKSQFLDFVKDWENNNEKIVPYSARLLDMNYEEWLDNTHKSENKETCLANFVPAHTYFLTSEDNRIVGAINIRHYLNDHLLKVGGNIGYGVRPSERKKGYASLMLNLGLDIAKELGINRVLVTCNKTNIASAKTIMKNGGVLENEVLDDGELVQRYWIDN